MGPPSRGGGAPLGRADARLSGAGARARSSRGLQERVTRSAPPRGQNEADPFKRRRLALGGRSNVRRPAQTVGLGVRLQHTGHPV
eukprot:7919949-Lingulodinium_polyedra.AAC.1